MKWTILLLALLLPSVRVGASEELPRSQKGRAVSTCRNRYGMVLEGYGDGKYRLKREKPLRKVLGDSIYDLPEVLEPYRYVSMRITPEAYEQSESEVICYKNVGDSLRLYLEAELPRNAVEPVPFIVWIHGGGWKGGSPSALNGVARLFASYGYASFCVRYRLRNGETFSHAEQLQDISDAVAYIRRHAGALNVDPDRYAYIGGSAGGQLALISGINDVECDAVVPMFAVYDIGDFYAFLAEIGQENDSPEIRRFFAMDDAATFRSYNSVMCVKKEMPPVLVLHGTGDSTVPYRQCEDFMRRMAAVGAVCEQRIFENYEHNFTLRGSSDAYEEVQFRIHEFLDKYLK